MTPYHHYLWNNDIYYKYVAGKIPGCAKSKSQHSAVFCVGSFLKLNLKSPEVRVRKPNPARETYLKPIRHGLSKVLLNGYKLRRNDNKYRIKKSFGLLRKQYIWRITITTINHLQDGICYHGCCRWPGAKQAPGHQQPPCCKYRLFTRFHWKLICEDNIMHQSISLLRRLSAEVPGHHHPRYWLICQTTADYFYVNTISSGFSF